MIPEDVMRVIDDNAENVREIASSLAMNADDLLTVLDSGEGLEVEREITRQLSASYERMWAESDEFLVLYSMLKGRKVKPVTHAPSLFPRMAEGYDDWSGIYLVERSGMCGFLEVHEWEGADSSDFEGDIRPDGYWYHQWRVGDLGDGGVLGYNYGESLHDLAGLYDLHLLAFVAPEESDLYEFLLGWIEVVA
ncbi:MAG: hypothetical protein Q4Q62_05325 [Thermoplasmata archaeon]|nr:hypothetical protein [Thermoplasmata archaeon]